MRKLHQALAERYQRLPRHRRFQIAITCGVFGQVFAQFHNTWVSLIVGALTTVVWVWEQ